MKTKSLATLTIDGFEEIPVQEFDNIIDWLKDIKKAVKEQRKSIRKDQKCRYANVFTSSLCREIKIIITKQK